MNVLEGKTVVITGASSGLGATLAKKLSSYKCTLILISRSHDKLRNLTEELRNLYQIEVAYYSVDISDKQAVQHTFEQIFLQFSKIDILINNAGFGLFQTLEEASIESYEEMIKVNYLGAVYCTKQVLPIMLKKQKGHIINICSQAGKVGTPKSTAYAASKHAILGFSNSLHYELKPRNIHVTAVNPGPIRTSFFEISDPSGSYQKNIASYLLEPEEVADCVIKGIIRPRREINLPWWMDIGSRLFHLFPSLMDRLATHFLHKK